MVFFVGGIVNINYIYIYMYITMINYDLNMINYD